MQIAIRLRPQWMFFAMLQSSRFKRIYIACVYTDLRYGINRLADVYANLNLGHMAH